MDDSAKSNKPYGFCPDPRQAAYLLSFNWNLDNVVTFASVDEVCSIYVGTHRDMLLLLGLDSRQYKKNLRRELLRILLD